MVGGHDVVMEVFLFVQCGLEFDTLALTRTFLFGGDHRCLADWSTPAGVDRRRQGRSQCFLVSGSMPILIGRPLLKALKVKVELTECP